MVVRRTIHKLRSRPKEDRTAIAGWTAILVVVVLFVGWVVFFFQSAASTSAPNFQGVGSALDTSGLQQASEQLQQGYGSTTQFTQSENGFQIEQISTSTQ